LIRPVKKLPTAIRTIITLPLPLKDIDISFLMSMEIIFDTKVNNNLRRQKAFLALSPHERFMFFLQTFDLYTSMTPKQQIDKNRQNFILFKT